MLFVSPKEPLTVENLPDTSLHNVRVFISDEHRPSSGSSSFISPSQACIPKLTKQDLDLHREFLRLGSLLMSENADLFHQALSLLSAKHNLKVATPATSVSDIVPPTRYSRRSKTDGSTASDCSDFAAPRASYRKYVLPKDTAAKEFYQCRVCKERRPVNSFGVDHVHADSTKSDIRWYCPLCDTLYAVTHRGYHLKSHHKDVLTVVPSQQSSAEQKPAPVAGTSTPLKRARQDDGESALYLPPEKMRPVACASSSPSASVASLTPSCYSHTEEAPEEEISFVATGSPSTASTASISQQQQEQQTLFSEEQPLFLENEFPSLFSSLQDHEYFL